MTKEEMLIRVSARAECDKKLCEKVISNFFDVVVYALADEGQLLLRGVGRFESVHRSSKRIGNLNGPGTIETAPRKVVRFRPAQQFEDKVQNLDHDQVELSTASK